MHIYFDQGFYKIAHVSGPTHNFLGLSFSDEPVAQVAVEALDAASAATPTPNRPALEADAVLRQVLAGAEAASARLQRRYVVRAIQFVPSDSAPVEIYRELTQAIIEHIHGQR